MEQAPDFTEELAAAKPTLLEMSTKDVTISIIGVKTLSSYFVCSACGKIAEETGKLLKCDTCKLQKRVSPESKQWYVKLFVQDITTKDKLYITLATWVLIAAYSNM